MVPPLLSTGRTIWTYVIIAVVGIVALGIVAVLASRWLMGCDEHVPDAEEMSAMQAQLAAQNAAARAAYQQDLEDLRAEVQAIRAEIGRIDQAIADLAEQRKEEHDALDGADSIDDINAIIHGR